AEEHVDEPEHRIARMLEEGRQPLAADARGRDRHADAIHAEHRQREQHAAAKLRNTCGILEPVEHAVYELAVVSTVPPAATIFSRALALTAATLIVNGLAISPSERILIGPRPLTTRSRRSRSSSTTVPAANRSSRSSDTTS